LTQTVSLIRSKIRRCEPDSSSNRPPPEQAGPLAVQRPAPPTCVANPGRVVEAQLARPQEHAAVVGHVHGAHAIGGRGHVSKLCHHLRTGVGERGEWEGAVLCHHFFDNTFLGRLGAVKWGDRAGWLGGSSITAARASMRLIPQRATLSTCAGSLALQAPPTRVPSAPYVANTSPPVIWFLKATAVV